MSISNRIISDIFTLSVFKSKSRHKYTNKYDRSDILLSTTTAPPVRLLSPSAFVLAAAEQPEAMAG
jgi:hypothetical protein